MDMLAIAQFSFFSGNLITLMHVIIFSE